MNIHFELNGDLFIGKRGVPDALLETATKELEVA